MKPKHSWIITLQIDDSFSENLSKREILELINFDTPHYIDVKVLDIKELDA